MRWLSGLLQLFGRFKVVGMQLHVCFKLGLGLLQCRSPRRGGVLSKQEASDNSVRVRAGFKRYSENECSNIWSYGSCEMDEELLVLRQKLQARFPGLLRTADSHSPEDFQGVYQPINE